MNNTKMNQEGECATCGTPIPANKRLCPACRQENQDVRKNVRTWKGLAGEIMRRQLERVGVTEEVSFSVGPFPSNNPCGRFLETLISVCYERPSYLHISDVARHASLIDALMQFQSSMGEVKDLPFSKLDVAAREWVFSLFDESYHPLMPIYAMDTARFVLAHGGGVPLFDGESMTQISAMVAVDSSTLCLDSPSFKREFAKKSAGRELVFVTVPKRCGLIDKDRRGWFGSGGRFLFQITHYFVPQISRVHLEVVETDAPKYDISNAPLPGKLWLDEGDLPINNPSRTHEGKEWLLHVPLRWITHAVRKTENKYIRIPVPTWD